MAEKTTKQAPHFKAWRMNKNTLYRWQFIDGGNILAQSERGYTTAKAAVLGGKRAVARMQKLVALPVASEAQQVDARREVDPAPQPRRGLFGMRRG